MKSSKKGQLAVPFHWVFILIAGTLILIFFIAIVFKQKAVAEEKLSAELISSIEEIFTGAGVGEEEAIHVIDIPKTEFSFICEEDTGYSEYSIKDTGIPRQTPIDPIFAPDIVKGKELIIWSLPWSLPFKVTNFLMVTSSDVRYVIYYDPAEEEFAQQLKFDLPDPMTVDLVDDLADIKDTANYKIKFVFIGVDPTAISLGSALSRKPNKDVSAIKIEGDRVIFYEKQNDKFVQEYGGDIRSKPSFLPSYNDKDTMYYAAMFASNADQYRCNLKKVFQRLQLVAGIYQERTDRLRIYYETSDPQGICKAIYPQGPSGFPTLLSFANLCLDDLDAANCRYQSFADAIEGNLGIRERNIKLQENGCLLIY